jgi:hypothetical protein
MMNRKMILDRNGLPVKPRRLEAGTPELFEECGLHLGGAVLGPEELEVRHAAAP